MYFIDKEDDHAADCYVQNICNSPGAPNEECLGKRLEWLCTFFHIISVPKGKQESADVKANTF